MENIEELRTNTFVNGSPMNTISPSIVSKNFILSNSGIVPFESIKLKKTNYG